MVGAGALLSRKLEIPEILFFLRLHLPPHFFPADGFRFLEHISGEA
jgi:hypothetical protein